MKASINWREKMEFAAEVREHGLVMDASKLAGGADKGPTPKELVLVAICGCTGMDVVSYLRKSKTDLASLLVTAEAEQTKTHPKVFERVIVTFDAKGAASQKAALIEAVDKSQTLYCGVSAMIAKACPISYRVLLNGETVHTGQAVFPN